MSLPRRHAGRALGGTEQKESMKELNERLAGYMAHVGNLEETNLQLERKILERLQNNEPQSSDWSKKEETWRKLRHEISQANLKNACLAMAVHSTEMELNHLKSRYEMEKTNRKQLRMKMEMLQEMQAEISQLIPSLQSALEEAHRESDFQKLEHEEAVQSLLQSGQPRNEVQIALEEDGTGMALSQLLAELRAHYEELIFSTRVPRGLPAARAQLEKEAIKSLEKDEEDLKAAREELKVARRQWMQLQVEVESLRAKEKGLQMSLCSIEQQYQSQLENLSTVIDGLETELQEVRQGMCYQLRQHEELLNTKMRLEHEIKTYRGLLEKEENRFFDSPHSLESQNTEIKHRQGKTEMQSHSKVLHNGVTPKYERGDSTEDQKGEDSETLKTSLLLNGMRGKEGVQACLSIHTDNVDRVIKQWESTFFKENPHLRKKSANLCFDLHMEPVNGEKSPAKSEEVPDIEVRLIMKRSRSIPSVSQ